MLWVQEVKQQIILLVLERTVARAQETFGKKDRATALINDTIDKLQGDLLWIKILHYAICIQYIMNKVEQ